MKTGLDILGRKEFVAGRLLWGWPITPALTLQVLHPAMIGHPTSLVVHMSGVIQKERHFWFDSRVVALNFLGCLRIPWGTCHTARFLCPPLRCWPRRSVVGLRRLCLKHPGDSYTWPHSSGAPSARLEGKSGTFPKPLCPHEGTRCQLHTTQGPGGLDSLQALCKEQVVRGTQGTHSFLPGKGWELNSDPNSCLKLHRHWFF